MIPVTEEELAVINVLRVLGPSTTQEIGAYVYPHSYCSECGREYDSSYVETNLSEILRGLNMKGRLYLAREGLKWTLK